MPSLLVSATLAHAADGTPYSAFFDDVYHTADGGLGQARHVFLEGSGLPGRWRGRGLFTIVETGFGLGLNFLTTWAAWRSDPERCARLHYVSVEKHPFRVEDLALAQAAWPEFAPLAEALRCHWPTLTPGFHRIHLDDGRLTLTLLLGDAPSLLPQLVAKANAFYLDGFAPDRNPELWSPDFFAELARLAAPGASIATWSANGQVRRDLNAAGFSVEREPGFGGKREMLAGRITASAEAPRTAARSALIIGAGLAGSATAERLAAHGWTVTVIDAAAGPGEGASGNRAGVFRPLPSLDDNRLARLTRAGFLYGRRHLDALAAAGHAVRESACGVLHLGRDAKQEARQRAVVETQQLPADFLRFVDRDEASTLAGWPVDMGGWHFPSGGWIQPPSLCAALIAMQPERIRTLYGRPLARLERQDGAWVAMDAAGLEIARAPLAILAMGVGVRALPEAAALPVRLARGQVSHLPASPDSPPRLVVCRLGYVSPEIDGVRCAGATFLADDEGEELREAEHRENLTKLDFILPGYAAGIDPSGLAGRVGFRPASPDRLPMVGAVPLAGAVDKTTPLGAIARHEGLYAVSGFGARGLVWASLMGELLACQLSGEALPIEKDLVDALDPARYLLKPPRPLAREE